MHPDHVARLLKNPKLMGIEDPAKPFKPISTSEAFIWTTDHDRQFEEQAEKYETGKLDWRDSGKPILTEITAHPVGRFWEAAWSWTLLGGINGKEVETAKLLLPVLRQSQSAFVLDLVHGALRSIHRNFHSSLGVDLRDELTEALDHFDVQKMEVRN
jgi:hypothetical protein